MDKMKRRLYLFLIVMIPFLGIILVFWKVRAVAGVIYDEHGQPLSGATVRIRASQHATQTDSDGRFVLTGFPPSLKVRLTAWVDGYYVNGRSVWPWDGDVTLTLSPYTVTDNESYAWIPPAIEQRSILETLRNGARLAPAARLAPDALFFKLAEDLTLGCSDCHGEVIYDQWVGGAHALGFANHRFASMYNGSDLNGNQSPDTRYATSRDYGTFPLRPDSSKPYYGPGYKLDFPNTAGNCAACHLPAAALAEPYGTDPRTVSGVNTLGSHCDFCHKIAEVHLDPETGQPYENMPGVLSIEMMRPGPEKQIFFGPYDDVDAGSDTYLPLQRQSQFCAPCHTASFWGVPIYESFTEWLASPFSHPETGQTCQDCHMKPDGVTTNFAPAHAGQERDPEEIFTHSFPGASDEALLQNAASMDVKAKFNRDQLLVTVTITNDKTGHHVPTDSPLRQMILLVEATDLEGNPLPQVDGPTVPLWGGVWKDEGGRGKDEGTAGRYFAGRPGTGYAKILQEMWTEVTPTGAYWNPTRILSDNRIPAMENDTTHYTFAAPAEGEVTVTVQLLYRRAFIELMDQKGWEVADILMAEQSTTLSAGSTSPP